ncbi:MAG: response regulator transcription factor [Proteobacteria bacterium]|nr:response regulator transcription factor [Pseudomonadota bacterium]
MSMIRVISADDHALVRGGVKRLLTSAAGIDVVGEAAEGVELLQLLQRQPCDVLLLDITMPGKDGLTLLKEVRDKWPGIAVVIVSMHPERQYAARALRAGARGYLTKEGAQDQLIDAVRTVVAGGLYVSPALAQVLADQVSGDQGKLAHETLSDRELKVLVRLGSGKTVSEIADELFLSVNTVKTYRARLLAKLGLATTFDLIQYVTENKLGG